MNNLLFKAIKWDSILIYKYGIVAVAAAISFMYAVGFALNNMHGLESLVAMLIFTDPVMYGFLFTAVLVLFEKDAQTHQVIAVTPLPTSYYIISKATVFTLLSLCCSLVILISARPETFHVVLFFLAVVLSSTLFVFIGVIGVSFTNNFNQFILVIPLVLAPVCLPLLNYFNVYNSWWFNLIPSQACLFLFKGSVATIKAWQIWYSIVYLIAWNIGAYVWAIKSYKKRILKII